MMYAFIGVLASLVLLVALNWRSLNALGAERVSQMLAIWTGIVVVLFIALRLLGY